MSIEQALRKIYTNADFLESITDALNGTLFHRNYLLPHKKSDLCRDVLNLQFPLSGDNELSNVLYIWFGRIRMDLLRTHEDTFTKLKKNDRIQDLRSEMNDADIENCVAWAMCFACLRSLVTPYEKPAIIYVIK